MQHEMEVDGGCESGEVHTGVVMVKDEEGLWCGWCGCDEAHPCPFLVLRAEGGTANCTGLADILLSLTHTQSPLPTSTGSPATAWQWKGCTRAVQGLYESEELGELHKRF